MNECCREMTYEELKIIYDEVLAENDNFKLINELLVKNVKDLRGDRRYLLNEVKKLEKEIKVLKKQQVEIKKEKLLNND
ncbi:hypothetical protein [Arcobacter sp.]|uniref:hypothetical protein n=1 Tax=Arcobacter sp. TaxID=1872629 RepID=UPI003D0A830F